MTSSRSDDLGNRSALRAATQEQHDRAERLWATDMAFANEHVYTQFLRVLLKAHETIGLPSAACLGDTSLSKEQARISALRADLGAPDDRHADRALADVKQDWAWGASYALNGSALGASILLKTGAVPGSWPSRYLNLMRTYAQTGALKQYFDDLDGVRLDMSLAASGARAVFEQFADHALTEEALTV